MYFRYNICRINNKAQIVKNSSSTVFHEVKKVSPDSKLTKLGDFLKESGDFLSLFASDCS